MALVLEGEAGIGKTTLLREAVAAASGAGASVLMAWPAPAEAELAFSGLGDLLADALDEVVPELPEPQAKALEIALLRRQAGGRPVDAHTVSAGVLSALRTLAERNPVVVAVDDVQWLDRGTAAALAFAFRRLSSGRVRLVASLRVEHASVQPELIDVVAAGASWCASRSARWAPGRCIGWSGSTRVVRCLDRCCSASTS